MEEYWDLFDRQGQLVGSGHPRSQPLPPGTYHKVVSVWIRDASGRYLMSRRCPWKRYPNLWECTGGCLQQGETELQAALREAEEETGLKLDPAEGKLLFSCCREEIHDFYTVWLFTVPEDQPALTLQASEVSDAGWLTMEEIEALEAAGELHPLLGYYRDPAFRAAL